MNKTNKIYLKIGLGVVTLWDTITTIYGTHTIAGDGPVQFLISLGFGIGFSVVLLRTLPIIKNPKEDFFVVSAKLMWGLVLLYDLYTAFLGNYNLLLTTVYDTPKVIIAVGLTIFTCYCPIYLSKLIFDTSDE
jgi:hypothetical protein